jgi:energy-converting hydrogenase Eha subunit C
MRTLLHLVALTLVHIGVMLAVAAVLFLGYAAWHFLIEAAP